MSGLASIVTYLNMRHIIKGSNKCVICGRYLNIGSDSGYWIWIGLMPCYLDSDSDRIHGQWLDSDSDSD